MKPMPNVADTKTRRPTRRWIAGGVITKKKVSF